MNNVGRRCAVEGRPQPLRHGASVAMSAPRVLKTCAKGSEEAEQVSVFSPRKLAQGGMLSA